MLLYILNLSNYTLFTKYMALPICILTYAFLNGTDLYILVMEYMYAGKYIWHFYIHIRESILEDVITLVYHKNTTVLSLMTLQVLSFALSNFFLLYVELRRVERA